MVHFSLNINAKSINTRMCAFPEIPLSTLTPRCLFFFFFFWEQAGITDDPRLCTRVGIQLLLFKWRRFLTLCLGQLTTDLIVTIVVLREAKCPEWRNCSPQRVCFVSRHYGAQWLHYGIFEYENMNACVKLHFISSCMPKWGSLKVVRQMKVVFVDHESGPVFYYCLSWRRLWSPVQRGTERHSQAV